MHERGFPALIVALVLGLALGGGAVAAVTIAPHSVGWNKLTPGLQKRIEERSSPGPQGATGPSGATGPQGERGPEGPPGEEPEEPQPPTQAGGG